MNLPPGPGERSYRRRLSPSAPQHWRLSYERGAGPSVLPRRHVSNDFASQVANQLKKWGVRPR